MFDSLARIELGIQEQPIGAFNRANAFGGKAAAFESDAIHAKAFCMALGDDKRERRNVLRNHGGGADVRIAADAAELMDRRKCADRGVVLHGHVASESGTIGENRVIADHAIVGHMSRGHKKIIASDACHSAALRGSAAHRDALAENVAIAHFQAGALARVLQVLGIASDSAEWMQHVRAA